MSASPFGQAAFKKSFDELAEPIRNFIYYKCGNLQMAEDIMQEAFLRLWRDRNKMDADRVKPYLYKVAGNLFLDAARHQQVVLRFNALPRKEADHENPQHVLEQKEFKAALEAMIASLPETQREVFLMNRIEKLTYQEIAERLGVSVKAVEKRMGKALKKMRKLNKKI